MYFQPPNIKPKYCEAGIIHESDPEHIWYLDEPCKILISDVKIIPSDKVNKDYKRRTYTIKKMEITFEELIEQMPLHELLSIPEKDFVKELMQQVRESTIAECVEILKNPNIPKTRMEALPTDRIKTKE